METEERKHACVLVLGDWGRSPRMQYHSLSLAKHGFAVDVVAYGGSEVHKNVKNHPFIKPHYLKAVPQFPKNIPRFIVYILKTLWQSFFLFFTLMFIHRPQFILVQNPPSIPALPVAWFVCTLRRCHLVIDFHNYGYTILSLAQGKNSILVKICRWCEGFFGRRAHCLCVTKAMKKNLAKQWGVSSTVFYDCPPSMFRPISTQEKHFLFVRLCRNYKVFEQRPDENCCVGVEQTRFTRIDEDAAMLLNRRPALIVSSTSWTEDEDFSILLEALKEYEKKAACNGKLPKLVVAITGKGPLKAMYEEKIEELVLEYVQIVTMWVDAEEYPKLLASADLGVCLHYSSSGLDLPMKVVDMFGSGLPVCAISYPCINELVKHGTNGLVFSDSEELVIHLQRLLCGFPLDVHELNEYESNLENSPPLRWDESWRFAVLPIIQKICP